MRRPKQSKVNLTWWAVLAFNFAFLIYALAAIRTPYSVAKLIDWLASVTR